MMKKRNVYTAIIGGGAAGMMCAVRLAQRRPDKKIVLIEKADRVGKKLLVTGNGRCNLSHVVAGAEHYRGEGSDTLVNILFENYSSDAVVAYFRTLGLLTHVDSEGRVYPLSNQSNAVLDVLRQRMAQLGIEEICNAEIQSIQKTAEGYEIAAADQRIYAEKIVIATGGKVDYAGRESGSRELLRSLGLRMSSLSPSLSPVKVKSEILRSLKGIRAQAQVSLYRGRDLLKTERGEVQFNEGALSGICVFDLSRDANRGGCEIHLDLLPDYSDKEIYCELTERIQNNRIAAASELFTGIFHKNLGQALLKACGIKPSSLREDISDKEIKRLCQHCKAWRFVCEENHDFKKAQVTAGGVMLSEIDPHTFESRRHKGLFLIGEALDVDGDCGGYNLQFAFASGMCAGDRL